MSRLPDFRPALRTFRAAGLVTVAAEMTPLAVLKSFAQRTLPKTQDHLKRALKLEQELKVR